MKKIILIIACLMFSVAVCAAEPPKAPLTPDDALVKPPEWTALLSQSKQVQDSKALTAQAKAVIAADAARVEVEFAQVWTPWVAVIKDMNASNKKVEDAEAEIQRHNRAAPAQPDLYNKSAVEKYNKDIVPYNDEANRLEATRDAAVKKAKLEQVGITARGEAQIKKIEDWFAGQSYKGYMKVTNGLLTGRIQWKEGLAWRQLVEASKGYRDPQFDGADPESGPDAVDTSSGTTTTPQPTRASTNTVDSNGVAPWKPGEREAELKKPGVQPPAKPKPKPPPPPR